MKVHNVFNTVIVLATAFVAASTVTAENAKPAETQPAPQPPAVKQFNENRLDFLQQLGLTEEQRQQVSKLHQEQKPLMEAAQKRFREANRALNEAIYADQMSEADIQLKIKERQIAQADVEKLRFMNEFAVRRILTQEQLVRFRELRQQFEKMREAMETRRRANGDRPFSRQRPGNNPKRPQTTAPSAQPSTSNDQQRQDL